MANTVKEVALDMLDCWRRLNLEDALSRLADNAVFQPDCKSAPVVGREAIRTVWAGYMQAIKNTSSRCETYWRRIGWSSSSVTNASVSEAGNYGSRSSPCSRSTALERSRRGVTTGTPQWVSRR
jgi:hypothetical protein